ncbi:C-C chemokine receptor type 9-like [Rhincodon typus]|uniref:C-C chemokine receptor type 9-like n=1 Tax=Rhincodon typus TaxID=259920 RepID=UPI00202E7F86|nr:C-C chemokine receptor type 9-like [Rhincodon typus]XP_048474629.1 C-C chemokine receptor type 9-like [Rhincodon typus]XP_048474637.1 C-C chemokine receptor type 9-like [Rhincodon typus]
MASTTTGIGSNEDFLFTTVLDYSHLYDYDEESSGMCRKSDVRQFAQHFTPPFYTIVFLLGFVGNILVVVIYALYKRLRNMTDVYLLNLAIADLLFLCTLPFWALDARFGWIFGNFLCKTVRGFYKINFFSCMLLLTCISIDRYIAIVKAVKARVSKQKIFLHSKLISLVVWVTAVLLSLPDFRYSSQNESQQSCSTNYPGNILKVAGLAMQITVGFFLPFAVMLFCYSTIIWKLLQAKSFQKHRAIKLIGTVVSVFVLSQLPYNSMMIVKAMDAANITITDCETLKNVDIATEITQSIAFLHSCLNPFLYAFLGVRFRQDLLRIMKDIGCVGQRHLREASRPQQTIWKRSSVHSETDTTGTLSL